MQVPTDYVVQMDVCLSQWGCECETEDSWLFWLLDVVFGCLVRWESNPVVFDKNDLDDAWKLWILAGANLIVEVAECTATNDG
jgi:hypothetical protein